MIKRESVVAPTDGGERCQCLVQSRLLHIADGHVSARRCKRLRTGQANAGAGARDQNPFAG